MVGSAMAKIKWALLLLVGLSSDCARCIPSGTCGCKMGHVVCCDGTEAYECLCR